MDPTHDLFTTREDNALGLSPSGGRARCLIGEATAPPQDQVVIDSAEPRNLSRVQQLRVLRWLDQHRWNSLSEKRRCLACGDIFSGGEVAIVGGTRSSGPLRLLCPGVRCDAGPGQWEPVETTANVSHSVGRLRMLQHRKRDGHNAAVTTRRRALERCYAAVHTLAASLRFVAAPFVGAGSRR